MIGQRFIGENLESNGRHNRQRSASRDRVRVPLGPEAAGENGIVCLPRQRRAAAGGERLRVNDLPSKLLRLIALLKAVHLTLNLRTQQPLPVRCSALLSL